MVKGMVRNRRLARAISDAGFGEFRRMLEDKAESCGCRMVVGDRFYPSAKTSSDCRLVKDKWNLSERVFTCEACGFGIERDRNAAIHLAHLAQAA